MSDQNPPNVFMVLGIVFGALLLAAIFISATLCVAGLILFQNVSAPPPPEIPAQLIEDIDEIARQRAASDDPVVAPVPKPANQSSAPE